MRDYYIFDIPVYRCSEEQFDVDMAAAVAKRHDEFFATTGISRENAPESYKNIEEHTRQTFGGPWNFNQVVGWLRLFAEPSHVGGHLWWVDKKRIQRVMREKRFILITSSDVLGNYFTPEDDSDEIYRGTLEDIKRLSRQSPLKDRYVNLGTFLNIGPYIDWRSLLNSISERTDDL